ncbi:MAG: prepilin-type N-terminal cleavage/methylation domain-containing protein [Candidatus Magasanikbacteria bacterium]|nr:prepilin-type N-terminal cleavage/methylation domain-containing protein [Candidatus Magasanikbacteria bacterium]
MSYSQSISKSKQSPGFTLIEMFLAISLIAILAGIFLPLYQVVYVKNDLDLATASIVQSLRRAQVLAQANDGDTSWGVAVAPGTVTLFQGSNYAGRITAADEVFTFSTGIIFAGWSEIVFSKVLGEPTPVGALTLTASNNDVHTITLTNKGTLAY